MRINNIAYGMAGLVFLLALGGCAQGQGPAPRYYVPPGNAYLLCSPSFSDLFVRCRYIGPPLVELPGPSLRLSLPDLIVSRPSCKTDIQSQIYFEVRVSNAGSAPAGPFRVRVTLFDATTGQQFPPPDQLPDSGPSPQNLNPMDHYDFPLLGPINFPFPAGGLAALATADPPTTSHPGGDIWESDETNNQAMRTFVQTDCHAA